MSESKDFYEALLKQIEADAIYEFKKVLENCAKIVDNKIVWNEETVTEFVRMNLDGLAMMKKAGYDEGYQLGYLHAKKKNINDDTLRGMN